MKSSERYRLIEYFMRNGWELITDVMFGEGSYFQKGDDRIYVEDFARPIDTSLWGEYVGGLIESI